MHRLPCYGRLLRSVGSIKLWVSFAYYRLFYRALLQKRPIILSILLTKATPYLALCEWNVVFAWSVCNHYMCIVIVYMCAWQLHIYIRCNYKFLCIYNFFCMCLVFLTVWHSVTGTCFWHDLIVSIICALQLHTFVQI